jgi:hypothetical protein
MIPLQWKQVEVINSMRTAPLPLDFVWVEATATQKCHIKEFRNDHAQGDFRKGITNCYQTHGTTTQLFGQTMIKLLHRIAASTMEYVHL